MKVKKMWAMSDEERHRLRLGDKPRQYVITKRKFTREQLLEYLRKNNFTSAGKLDRGRKPDEPSSNDCRKEFGNWENARAAAFGMRPMDFGPTAEYVTKCVVQFSLWTADLYRAKRKEIPDVVPSLHFALKRWGRFSNLIGAAMKDSFKAEIDAYGRLWRRLGRAPTLEEARIDGVPLDKAIAYYNGKHELDKLMVLWKESDEGKA